MAQSIATEALAHHEAAHAVVSYALDLRFKYVTVLPSEDALGHIRHIRHPKWFKPDIDPSSRAKAYAERHIVTALAGQIGESVFLGKRPKLGQQVNSEAVDMASLFCGGSDATLEAHLNYCWCMAKALVDLHWSQIQALAAALLERKTIRYRAAVEIISTAV